MSELSDARTAIEDAAKTVEGIRTYALGADLTPPAVVVGPPRLEPLASCPGPATAVFPVEVVVALGDRSLEQLWDLVPAVWAAIEESTDGVVTTASPGTYTASTELPCYELTVEFPI